jgi:hypothetical protein
MNVTRGVGAVVALVMLVPAAAAAQQQPTPEMIARAQELMAPGPEHRVLAGLAGTWDQEIRMWPEPGAPPMALQAVSENRMILGGRFLESRSTFEFGGTKGESISILGFDRRHEKYTAIGLDEFGTYWVTAAGTASPDGWFVMRGTDDDPVLGGTQEYEFRLRIVDANTYVWEVVFLDAVHTRGGGPFRMVEITNRRRQ